MPIQIAEAGLQRDRTVKRKRSAQQILEVIELEPFHVTPVTLLARPHAEPAQFAGHQVAADAQHVGNAGVDVLFHGGPRRGRTPRLNRAGQGVEVGVHRRTPRERVPQPMGHERSHVDHGPIKTAHGAGLKLTDVIVEPPRVASSPPSK